MSPNQQAVLKHFFIVEKGEESLRLDQVIPLYSNNISRTMARRLIQTGAAWVNGARVQILSRKVCRGDKITLYIGREGGRKYYDCNPENILYQDDWLLFYRKEPYAPSQALACDNYNNLYAALLRYLKREHAGSYLGMHHRLDHETSGVILFALSKKINSSIHNQFKDHLVKKTYLALVAGKPAFEKKILSTYIRRRAGNYECSLEGPGKSAVCAFTRVVTERGFSLIRAEPETGRTHQIRLQLAFLGLPVLGDPLYGAGHSLHFPRTMLHAEKLSLVHPIFKKQLTVTAALFEDMRKVIEGITLPKLA